MDDIVFELSIKPLQRKFIPTHNQRVEQSVDAVRFDTEILRLSPLFLAVAPGIT